MLKDIKDAREISCKNALDGRYITTDHEWKELDDDTCHEIFDLCKEYVAKTARGNRRTRILNAWKSQVKSCGILGRLVYNFERENKFEIIYLQINHLPGGLEYLPGR